MSIPNEALQRLVQEIETRAIQVQQQVKVVRAQITAKQRDIRLLELTSNEVKILPKETKVYEGVGKMFVASPLLDVERRLLAEASELKSDMSNLEKKLHYLETTQKNSKEHLDAIFQTGGRA